MFVHLLPSGNDTHCIRFAEFPLVVYQMHLIDYLTSTIVFYRTRVYQMQPRKSKRSKFVEERDNYNSDTTKIGIRTPLNRISTSGLSQKNSWPHFAATRKIFVISGKEFHEQSFKNEWNRKRNLHLYKIRVIFPVSVTTEYKVNVD